MMTEEEPRARFDEPPTMGGDDSPAPDGNPAYPVTPEDGASYDLLARYLQRRREQLKQLAAALDHADYELIRRIGHNLHGSGTAYGLPRISVLGQALETAAELREPLKISEIISQLRLFLASVTLNEPRQ